MIIRGEFEYDDEEGKDFNGLYCPTCDREIGYGNCPVCDEEKE